MPDKKYTRWATSLIGGGDGALDSYDGTLLQDEEMALTNVLGDKFYTHILNATSGAVASPPEVIAPVLNAGLKRWILQSVHTKIDGIDIDGAVEAGAPITDATKLIVDLDGTGDNHSIFASRLKTYIGTGFILLSSISFSRLELHTVSSSIADLTATISIVST